MMRPYLYLLLLLLPGLLGGCYKDAPDKELEGGKTIVDDEDDEEDIEQNRWTYKQMRSDYLWEAYLPDEDELSFGDYPKRFFESLLYDGDRFSWIELNESFSGSSLYDNYGIDYLTYETVGGEAWNRTVAVRHGSPAWKAGLRRGHWFRPAKLTDNESITIETGQLAGSLVRPTGTLRLLQDDDQPEAGGSVELDTTYHVGDHTVGYIVYNEFVDGSSLLDNPYRAELRAAFERFREQGITDLVIDLRYNRGGHVTICEFFAALLLRDEILGTVSGYHSFNKHIAAQYLKETGSEEETLYFPTPGVVGGCNVALDRLTFLISAQTASASESLINNVSPFIDVTLIGATSTGKGVGSWTIRSPMYEWQLQPITFRYYNSLHQTVPDAGLTPDIYVDESTAADLFDRGDTRELLLQTALAHITGVSLRDAFPGTPLSLRLLDESVPGAARRISGYIDNRTKNSYQ
ncbi:MAG: hypothetical protein LBS05_09295 [Tannerellaceae bacterium]|jgi:C-terminal processing protease CtpA/Prc|nr:hypothetical protein [Tannerellaceae bacterium]